jgi:hypothetical protein
VGGGGEDSSLCRNSQDNEELLRIIIQPVLLDRDPDPNFHVDADPELDPDPDWHLNVADFAPSFKHVGKSNFL